MSGLYDPAYSGSAFIVYVALQDMAIPGSYKANPTIATGDFKYSMDGGALANVDAQSVAPAASIWVKLTINAGNFVGDWCSIQCIDQTSPKEWADFALIVPTHQAVVPANMTQVDGVANASHASGMVPADARDILGTAISTPATAGILDVNVKNLNNVAGTPITTIGANVGTTQPVNFTGTGASALVKDDVTDIAGAAVNTALAQVGVNVVSQANIDFGGLQKASLNAATPAVTVSDKTGFSLSPAGILAILNVLVSDAGIVANSWVKRIVDFLTGDAYTRIGVAGVGLTNLGDTRIANLDATITSRLASASYTAPDNADIVAILARTDVATSTRLATAGYTAPDNADIIATKAVTDKLDTTLENVGGQRFTTHALMQAPTGGAAPTVQQIVNGVWDEPNASHVVAGSTGDNLASAATGGDPWATALPDGYVAGEAGYILGNLMATVFPAGANQVTITIHNSITTLPIDGAKVWISTDLAGANVIWAGATDAFGVARNVLGELPALNNGLYYRWVQDSGYTDSNPTAMPVSP